MVLREGDKAPDFNLKDTSGKQITLNGLLGKRIVIYFYPIDSETHKRLLKQIKTKHQRRETLKEL